MADFTLVVMAAGIGSRYGGLKQVDPIGPHGEMLIDYAVYDALKTGFNKLVFIIRRDIEATFKEKVGRRLEKHIQTLYVYQELDNLPPGWIVPPERTKPWGTAQAILCCQDCVASPFAVINADDFYGRAAYQLLSNYLKKVPDRDGVSDYCLMGYVLGKTLSEHGHVARGVCSIDEEGFLDKITERKKIQKSNERIIYTENDTDWMEISEETVVSMNMWGFTTTVFEELATRFPVFLKESIAQPKAEYLLPEIIGQLVREKKAKVKVTRTNEKWFGVTYKDDLQIVKEALSVLIKKGIYPEKLWG